MPVCLCLCLCVLRLFILLHSYNYGEYHEEWLKWFSICLQFSTPLIKSQTKRRAHFEERKENTHHNTDVCVYRVVYIILCSCYVQIKSKRANKLIFIRLMFEKKKRQTFQH